MLRTRPYPNPLARRATMSRTVRRVGLSASTLLAGCLSALTPDPALAQGGSAQGSGSGSSQVAPPAGTFQLPPVVVTAQKEPADPNRLPVSVTAVTQPALALSGSTIVSDAAVVAPNVWFTEFTARKLSNARVRGIGSSPANPGVTTLYDGVPQLNANSSTIELIGVDQVEFVRGPQSALFGRNALGGVVNVTSARPSLERWTGGLFVPLGNVDARDVRAAASGPLVAGTLGAAVALQYGRRDGFTRNQLTGNDLDSRSAFAAKAQLLWTPARQWEARLIVNGERARDGDYALSDLEGLRRSPYRTARDYEGFTHRDIVSTTVLARREGARVTLSSTTGFVNWKTVDSTDLDYTPLPLVRRDNDEESFQFTQEVRVASAAQAPVRLADRLSLRWQAGLFLFTQQYDQDAVNTFSPFLLSPLLAFPVAQHSPAAALDDTGIGVYGQGTAVIGDRVDVTAGLRVDHESKDAALRTFYDPAIAPGRDIAAERGFSNVSPQLALGVRLQPDRMLFASVARGFKAGGFNPSSPAGSEGYGEEHTWNIEGGLKSSWLGGRLTASAALFRIDWQDLQLNLPDPTAPGQFFIANVGGASSSGVEVEVAGRAAPGVDLFGSFGYTRARFDADSVSNGVAVGGNTVPNTPEYNAAFGGQLSRPLRPGAPLAATLFARAEVVVNGGFEYDDANTAAQDAYALTNLRAGVRGRVVFVEGWIRNAFDTRYIPVAFAYSAFAPSGFVGEMGRPRTFGITSGITF